MPVLIPYIVAFFLCWTCVEFKQTVDKKEQNKWVIFYKSLIWPFTLVMFLLKSGGKKEKNSEAVNTIRSIALSTNNEDFVGKLLVLSERSGKLTKYQATNLAYELGVAYITWRDTV